MAIVIVVLSLLLVVWYTIDVLVLVFTGILLAVFLRGLSDILSQYTPLGGQSSLLVVVILLLAIVGVGIWLLAPQLSTQIGQLTETLPRAIESLGQRLQQHGIGRWLLAQTPSLSQVVSEGNWLSRIARVFSTTFGVLASLVVILAVGLYLAISPRSYTEGVVRLVPIESRGRAREIVQAVGQTLRWWLLGRWVSMAVVGLLTAVGLWLLGVPLALTFGLLAAVLTFVPYLGPILSAVPPIIVVLTQQPGQTIYVILLYVGIQGLESYLVTPLVQERTISMPPALILTAQLVMGVLLGGMGVVLATPIVAVMMVLVNMLYVEDTLGDRK